MNGRRAENFTRGDRAAKAVYGICATVASIGILVLLGWTFEIETLKSIVPSYISMKANTATGLIAMSLALFLLFQPSKKAQIAAKFLALFAFSIGTLTLVEYLWNTDLGIDEFLFLDPMGVKGRFPRGRLAPITASCFVLFSLSLALAKSNHRRIRSFGQLFNFLTWIAAAQGLIGYITGITQSFGKAYYSQMALHTSISILLLSTGFLIATSREGMVAVLTKRNVGGTAARRMVASAVLIPSFVWWLSAEGKLAGLYDEDIATLIRVLGNMILFLAVAWHDSLNLHELDEERKTRNRDLIQSNDLLNSTVEEQSLMLEELRVAQKETKASQEAFEHIAETLPHMVWTMTPDRELSYMNQRGRRYFGFDSLEGVRIVEFIHPDEVRVGAERWAKEFERGVFTDVEIRYRGMDGLYRWHMVHLTATRDANGKIVQWTGSAINIDFIKRTMEELQSARLALELAQDAAQLGTWTFDVKRRIVLGSSFHDKLYGQGRTFGEITPEELTTMMHKDDRHIFKTSLNEAIKNNFSNYEMEYRVLWVDGSEHWLKAMARIVKDEQGNIIYHLGITFDVTDIHHAREESAKQQIREEAANESSRLKSEFLATMSHEIRTPINGVMGMTNILLDTNLSVEQREYANAIKRSGNSLLVVINDILDFSKIEANKLDFEEIDFNFNQAIDDASTSTGFLATKKGLTIEHSIDPAIPKVMNGDPGRLQQIISNLLSNAVKFTPAGSIKLTASCESRDEHATVVRIEVKDSGVGISPEAKGKLFQAFTQADSSTTRKFGGTGLGLSISRHLVERMSGKIGVESELGKGSTFWFTAKFKTAEVKSLPVATVEEAPRVAKRCRILIAEDVQINQIVALRMVEKLGHFAHAVANGKEVIDALHNGDYDLILMDCHMPEMDGFEATSEIRASKTVPNPEIWIVAMTASAMKGDKERCMAIGMNDYVSKPIEPKSLEKILNKWLIDGGKPALDVTA